MLMEVRSTLLSLERVDWTLELLSLWVDGVQIAGNRVQVLPLRRLGVSRERATSRLLPAEDARVGLFVRPRSR